MVIAHLWFTILAPFMSNCILYGPHFRYNMNTTRILQPSPHVTDQPTLRGVSKPAGCHGNAAWLVHTNQRVQLPSSGMLYNML